ncbi:TPA: GNAT family N-acetyltransferase [Legionella feeleii]
MITPSPIVTKRLNLRPAYDGDAESLFFNYCSDIESSRFLTRKPHTNIEQTSQFLTKWCDIAWKESLPEFAWVISLKNSREAIGVFLVTLKERNAEIHYGISRKFECQGLITEAGLAVVEWLQIQSDVTEISTVCDIDNHGSIRVLEKLGFENLGLLKEWLHLPAFGQKARDCYRYLKK